MKHHYREDADCLNCGTILQGHFCHTCGQENLQLKENFGHIMTHAILDYFHFDHKFLHTLKPLLFKPGKLTVDYMAGKRTQYLDPIRMYIFISLVYFVLLFSNNGHESAVEDRRTDKTHITDSIKNNINRDKILTPEQKKLADAQINKYLKPSLKNSTGNVAADEYDITPLVKIRDDGKDKDTSYAEYLQSQQKLALKDKDGFLSRYYSKKKFEWKEKKISPKEAISESFKHNFPKLMFLLLPIFALLLRLAFWKNHKYYVEYLIYSFHLHCFIFLFLAMVMLIKMIMPASWNTVDDWLDFITVISIVYYIYRSLRIMFNRGRFRTLSKMIGVSIAYSFTFGVCVLIFLAVTAALA
jgi:hypothetical protein